MDIIVTSLNYVPIEEQTRLFDMLTMSLFVSSKDRSYGPLASQTINTLFLHGQLVKSLIDELRDGIDVDFKVTFLLDKANV
jgi:hypothetical protein